MFSSFLDSERVNLLSYWDKELVCRFANQEFFKLFGKTSEEIIGKLNLEGLLGRLYKQHYPYITGVLKGHSQNYESEIFLHSGEKYKVIATYYPDIENGNILGFFAHITNLKEFVEKNRLAYGLPYFVGESKMIDAIHSQNNKIYEVAAFLKSQILSEFPSIEYLADLHSISISKMMRDFKRRFQISPYLYYRRLQMEFAENYINKTACSKKQMSVLLGFSNPANFAVCYKKYLSDSIAESTDVNTNLSSKELNRILVSQLPISIAMLDLQMNYLLVSKQWNLEFGFVENEIIGLSIFDFFPGTVNDLERVITKYKKNGLYHCGGEYRLNAKTDNRELKCIVKQWFMESGDLGGIIIYSL